MLLKLVLWALVLGPPVVANLFSLLVLWPLYKEDRWRQERVSAVLVSTWDPDSQLAYQQNADFTYMMGASVRVILAVSVFWIGLGVFLLT